MKVPSSYLLPHVFNHNPTVLFPTEWRFSETAPEVYVFACLFKLWPRCNCQKSPRLHNARLLNPSLLWNPFTIPELIFLHLIHKNQKVWSSESQLQTPKPQWNFGVRLGFCHDLQLWNKEPEQNWYAWMPLALNWFSQANVFFQSWILTKSMGGSVWYCTASLGGRSLIIAWDAGSWTCIVWKRYYLFCLNFCLQIVAPTTLKPLADFTEKIATRKIYTLYFKQVWIIEQIK